MKDVLVLGNVNADWVFRLDAPLRPGLETTGEDLGLRAGGAAANAASALAVADNWVRLVGFVGSDDTGERLLDIMAGDGRSWDLSDIVRLEGPTPSCLILIDPDGERVIIGTHRNNTPPRWPEVAVDRVACAYFASRWGGPAALITGLKAAGVPVVSQWRPGYTIGAADVLVTSQDELPPEAATDPWQAARAQGALPLWVVVTRGAAGVMAVNGDICLHCPAESAEVVDSTGAGDAFAGGLVHGLARGWPMEACLVLGARWGARAVSHLGSTFPKTGHEIARPSDTTQVRVEPYTVSGVSS